MVWNSEDASHTQYVNGVLTAQNLGGSLGTEIQGPLSGPWYIGYDDCCGGGRDFDGLIDDVSVWTTALTDSEIADMYQNGLSGAGVSMNELQVTAVELPDQDHFSLTWGSQPDQFYNVESTSSLDPANWVPILTGVRSSEGEETTAIRPQLPVIRS